MEMTADPTLPTCVVHRDRETRLRCARCGRPVCDVCLGELGGAGVCPSCRAELAAAAPARPARADDWRSAPVTYSLLAAYAVIFGLAALTGGTASPVTVDGAQINDLVLAGEWWRVLTATMLHASITHVLFNGYALYVLGPQLERGVGSAAFAALYTASGLAGGIAFLFSAPGQIAVGASGAIFGLFGAWFAAAWSRRHTPQGRAGFTQLGLLLLLNLALPLFIPGIAWQAHVGGLLVGLATGLAWAMHPRISTRRLADARRPADARPDPRNGSVPASSAARAVLPGTIAVALLAVLLWYT